MTNWLSLVIGVILGLLFGWLIDLLWRRRPGAAEPADDVVEPSREVESAVPPPPPVTEPPVTPEMAEPREISAPLEPDMEDALAAGIVAAAGPEASDVDLGVAPVEVAAAAAAAGLAASDHSEKPVEVAAIGGAEQADWPEISGRVAQVAGEIDEEPAVVRAEMAETPETAGRFSSDALEALAPAKDDFLRIEGIGRTYDGRLHAAGINTFADLVNAGEARLREIIQPQAWQRVNFADWIEQARLIIEGNEGELRLLQERLFKRKKD